MRLSDILDCSTCVNATLYGDSVNCDSADYSDRQLFNNNGRFCAKQCKSYIKREVNTQSGIIKQSDALFFMLAGKAEFVLHSLKTTEDFKFKLTRKEKLSNKEEFIYFVNVILCREEIYAGHIVFDNDKEQFVFYKGKKGELEASDRIIRSLLYVLNTLFQGMSIPTLEVYHVGNCGKCGKRLTTPESILTGLGPTCCKNLGIPRKKLR